jgi:hypothetical protein
VTTSAPDEHDAIAYVYEKDALSRATTGWRVDMIQMGGGGVSRPQDGVEYVYENDET